MMNLYELVQTHFGGKEEAHISWERPSYFSLDIDKDRWEVRLEGRYRAGVSPRQAAPVMSNFIKEAFGCSNVDVSNSSFRVALSNGQRMEIEHNEVVDENDVDHSFDHYVVDLYALDGRQKTRLMPVLAGIAEKVYDIALKDRYVTGGADHPFHNQGLLAKSEKFGFRQCTVSIESGLKHGTDAERKAYGALRKVRKHLSRKEWGALKAYDPALVERKPTTRYAKGIIIHEKSPSDLSDSVNTIDFCTLLENLPSSVRELPLIRLSSEDNGFFESVNLTASPIYRGNVPRLEYFAEKESFTEKERGPPLESWEWRSENRSRINEFGRIYQKLSGMSDKQLETAVARAAKKQE